MSEVGTDAALAIRDQTVVPSPMFRGAHMVRALADYRELQKALDEAMPDQLMTLDGKPFRKKGYWRAIAGAFGLTGDPITNPQEERSVIGALDDGSENYVYAVAYRATAPNGRSTVGDGSCAAAEKQRGRMKATEHNVRSHAHCVPLRAEILTRSGFRRHDEIEAGDEVLAYDCERDLCVWTPLRAINVFDQQPVVTIESKSFRAVCTPEHSWAMKRTRTRDRLPYQSLVKTSGLARYSDAMANTLVLAATAESGGHPLAAEDAAILGWLITDGSLRRPNGENSDFWRAHIDQAKPQYVEELRALVGAHATESVTPAGSRTFPTGNTSPTRPSHRFALRASKTRELLRTAGIESRADLPSLVTRLSASARSAMLDAMLKADGHQRWSATNDATWVFANKDAHVFEAFQILAALDGRALGRYTLEGPRQSRVNPISLQTLRSVRYAQVRALRIEESGREDVWCPTTDFGTWVMRLDGNVMVTGNTRAFNRSVSNLVGFGEVSAEEVERDEHGEAPAAVPQRADGSALVTAVETKTGTGKTGKSWTMYMVTFDDGRSGSTFDQKLATLATQAKEAGEYLIPALEAKGQYTNLTGLVPAGGNGHGGSEESEETVITEPQKKRLWAIAREHGWSPDEAKELVQGYGFEASEQITKVEYPEIVMKLKERRKPEGAGA